MSKEAMKLALEALENSVDLVSHEARNAEELYGKYPSRLARIQGLVAFEVAHEKAITALQTAMAEQPAQQEPVVRWDSDGWGDLLVDGLPDGTLLYTSPSNQPGYQAMAMAVTRLQKRCLELEGKQPAQQEPVAWANPNDLQNFDMKVRTNGGPLHTMPLYTSPQPAQRKPLTGEEINQIEARWDASMHGSKIAFVVRETEAAHGIKGDT